MANIVYEKLMVLSGSSELVSITINVVNSNPAQARCTRHNNMW